MADDSKTKNPAQEKSAVRNPRHKYTNYAQLVQGVGQVNDSSLEPTDRLFLSCLAAHHVKTFPHPGNKKLIRACGIKTRQGLNGIERRVLAKKLIEIVEPGGGRNHATVYRICVEDDRFPWPEKPASPDLPFPASKPASPELPVSERETRNSLPGNPQLNPAKPATLELHPDFNSGYKSGYKKESAAKSAAPSVPDWLPLAEWTAFLKYRRQTGKPFTPEAQELVIKKLTALREAGNDPAAVLQQSIEAGWTRLWPVSTSRRRFSPASRTVEDKRARLKKNLLAFGFTCPDCHAQPCACVKH